MAKSLSRPKRWALACSAATTAIAAVLSSIDEIEAALEELKELQQEYNDWKENLPESLSSSAVADKLEQIEGLQLEDLADNLRTAAEEAEGVIGEAEGVDLPSGFGRD